jgi:hypothetical protein
MGKHKVKGGFWIFPKGNYSSTGAGKTDYVYNLIMRRFRKKPYTLLPSPTIATWHSISSNDVPAFGINYVMECQKLQRSGSIELLGLEEPMGGIS